jgi:hypothetical protein
MTDPADGEENEPAGAESDPPPPPGSLTFQVPQRLLQIGGKYDPLPRREQTRSQLALGLVGLLVILAVGLVLLTAFKRLAINDTKDLIDGILSPLVALTGAALGFYFGGHQGSG